MAQVGNVVVKLSADSAQYRKGLSDAKKANDDFFKTLKGQLGEESKLGNLTKLLAGAGAVAGFTALGNLAGNWAKKVKEGVEAYRNGEVSFGEMVDQAARGLPIIGGWVTSGREIRESLDGTADYVKQVTEEAQRAEKRMAGMVARQKELHQFAEKFAKLRNETLIANMDEQGGARARIQLEFKDRQKEIDALKSKLATAGANEKKSISDQIAKAEYAAEAARQSAMMQLLKDEDAKRVDFEKQSDERIAELRADAERRDALLRGGQLGEQLYDIRKAFSDKEKVVREHYERLKKEIPSEAAYLKGQLDKELAAIAQARQDAEIEAQLADVTGGGPEVEKKAAQFSAATEQRFTYLIPGLQSIEDKKLKSTEDLTVALKENTKATRDAKSSSSVTLYDLG